MVLQEMVGKITCWGAVMGLRFRETLSGTYFLLDEPDQRGPIQLGHTAWSQALVPFLRKTPFSVEGWIRMPPICSQADTSGEIICDVLGTKQITYEFSFRGDSGQQLRLAGEKDLRLLDPLRSLSVLYASVFEQSKEIGRCEVMFDIKNKLVEFLLGVGWIP